jgi:hypothetical protein
MPLTVKDIPTHTLHPTDHLLRVCGQAAWHTPISLVDAAQLIRQNTIDWPGLRLGLPTTHCLGALAATLPSLIPPDVPAALAQIPTRYYERQAYAAQFTLPAHRTLAQRFWLHFARYCWAGEYQGVGLTPASLISYAQAAWQHRQMNRQGKK